MPRMPQDNVNSTASLMSMSRPSKVTDSKDSTEDFVLLVFVSSFTEDCILDCMILWNQLSWLKIHLGYTHFSLVGLLLSLQDWWGNLKFWKTILFIDGWIFFQAAYPIDTVRRRMMMTSAEKVKYRGGLDCISAIVRSEGVKSLYRGAGVNVVRGVAGAGVLSGFDKFKNLYIGWRVKL